jgi:glycerol-3-phosphate dehydrogenase (NAD(P)+)
VTARVATCGAGSWGTALAVLLARHGAEVALWCRDPARADRLAEAGVNERDLPGVAFPDGVRVTSDLGSALEGAEVVVGAVPSAATRAVAGRVGSLAGPGTAWLSAAKGIERGTHLRMTEVVRAAAPALRPAVLSGPSFAQEVAAGQPTAVVVAADDAELARLLQAIVSGPTFRAYASTDVVGVELGGAFKNVIALAAGLLAGLGLGHDPMAALVTRGLHEMTRLAVALGADARTLAGLSGLGDLVLTCTGPLSRNRQLGEALGRGDDLDTALARLGHVAEGVGTADRMVELGLSHELAVPIAVAVQDVLSGRTSAADAVGALMARSLKEEHE